MLSVARKCRCSFFVLSLLLTLMTNATIKANSVDPDQTAPIGAVWSESTLFVEELPESMQQVTKRRRLVLSVAL